MPNAIDLPRPKERVWTNGKWLSEREGIWQFAAEPTEDTSAPPPGSVGFTRDYLRKTYPEISAGRWRLVLYGSKPSPNLNRTVNDGFGLTFLVPSRYAWHNETGPQVSRVLLQADADLTAERATKVNRPTVPGVPGKWLSDELWYDERTQKVFGTDAYIEAHILASLSDQDR